jgi:hypothetical protein
LSLVLHFYSFPPYFLLTLSFSLHKSCNPR